MGGMEKEQEIQKAQAEGGAAADQLSLLIRNTPTWALSTHWVKRYFTTARKHRKDMQKLEKDARPSELVTNLPHCTNSSKQIDKAMKPKPTVTEVHGVAPLPCPQVLAQSGGDPPTSASLPLLSALWVLCARACRFHGPDLPLSRCRLRFGACATARRDIWLSHLAIEQQLSVLPNPRLLTD